MPNSFIADMTACHAAWTSGAGAIELAGHVPPNFWQQGHGGTTEFIWHLQLYEASPNFWDPNIRQHGTTLLGQPNFARWPRVTGRPSFYRIHHATRHSEGPKGLWS